MVVSKGILCFTCRGFHRTFTEAVECYRASDRPKKARRNHSGSGPARAMSITAAGHEYLRQLREAR